jgi:hypothetical protein
MFAQVNEVEIKIPFIALGSPCNHLGQSVPMSEPFHRRLARATKPQILFPLVALCLFTEAVSRMGADEPGQS